MSRQPIVQEKRFWLSILFLGLLFQILASLLMPIGLDAHVHATYVSDEIADGEASLDWGKLRVDGANQSVAEEIPADDKWFVWHSILEVWFRIFGVSLFSLHAFGLVLGLSALAVAYISTKSLWGPDNALTLTALLSIYSPLLRSNGRMYQESIVIMLATIIIYSIIKILRRENQKFWHLTCLLALAMILSIKGLPPKYAIYLYLPILSLEFYRPSLKPLKIPILIALTTVATCVLVWLRLDEIPIEVIQILPITILIAGVIYLYIGGLLFAADSRQSNFESNFLQLLSQIVLAVLCGYIVMLFLVEMKTLDSTREIVQQRFRYIYRYVTVLIVPLWWSQMAKQKEPALKVINNKNKILIALVITLMLIINCYILTIDRGIEELGQEINEDIVDGENILYIADAPLAMHRLYTLQITIDPNHDRNITGFWADESINWSSVLSENNISWVIITDDTPIYLDDDWSKFNTDTDHLVYHLN